ncbi:MAG: FISUMP domain-containing protein [archaeon]
MLKRLSFAMFLGVAIFTFFSCEKNPTESSEKVPELATSEVTDIGRTSATCGGTISSDGGSTITAKGVCWSTGQTPKVSDNKTTDGTGAGSFESEITGLTAGTNYYVRAYATNGDGTGYGSAMSFKTDDPIEPGVGTAEVSEITATTAKCGGEVYSDGGSAVIARGVCWSTDQNPTVSDSKTTDGTGTGSFTSEITGLTAGTDYYVCTYATNSIGTGHGGVKSFRTDDIPSVTTSEVSEITTTTAKCGGEVTSDGGSAVTSRGVCWSTDQNPTVSDSKTTDGTGTGSFTSEITGLTAETEYYVCAYATNNVGTGYGSVMSFTTIQTGTVTDIDGNTYQTVKIGNQWWMAENLKVTHYRNGEAIPNVTDNTAWTGLTSGAYCDYDNNATNADTYGRLYNWYAVDDSRNIAPTGWHVPTDAEWQTLVDYLGGDAVAGGKMKEMGTTHWYSPNTGATNESGFSALPGGCRGDSGTDYDVGHHGTWWSATERDSDSAWYRSLSYNNSDVYRYYYREQNGFSVRCVGD